jgi:hypothetical protein
VYSRLRLRNSAEFDMAHTISEPDWKLFRKLREIALDRFCQRVLAEVESLTVDNTKTAHERYLAVFRLIERRDRELATLFDNPRRSAALQQLVSIQSHSLLTEDEMSRFSPETRAVVQAFFGA